MSISSGKKNMEGPQINQKTKEMILMIERERNKNNEQSIPENCKFFRKLI